MAKDINFNTIAIAGAVIAVAYFLPKILNKPTESYTGSSGYTYEATQPTIRTDIRQAAATERETIQAEATMTAAEQKTARVIARQEGRTARSAIRHSNSGSGNVGTIKTSTPTPSYANGTLTFGGQGYSVGSASQAYAMQSQLTQSVYKKVITDPYAKFR